MTKGKRKREQNMELLQWAEQISPLLYRWELMKSRLTCSTASLEAMVVKLENGSVYRDPRNKGEDNPYLFIDNGADVLAVAHMDATGKEPHFGRVKIKGDEWILSRWVDDRLGVFLLLDVLPQFFKFDILLTTGEETSKSSARWFDPPKDRDYKWMFEPDRMGTDVVHYQYYSKAMETAVKAAGFPVYSQGAFSDIAELGFLGCAGINWGIGYEDNHGDWARANLTATLLQTARFCKFYDANQEVVFPYIPKAPAAPLAPAMGSGYCHQPATDSPNHGGTVYSKPLFQRDQIVKHWDNKRLLLVTSPGYWNAHTGKYTYWCMFRDPLNPLFTEHKSYDEIVLSSYMRPEEETLGWQMYPGGGIHDSKLRTLKLAPLTQGELPRRSGESVWPDTDKMNRINEGFAYDPKVMEARQDLEELLYADFLDSHSYCIPWKESYYLMPHLYYGAPVYTVGLQGRHKGTIDSPFPVIVRAEGDYWWVRFEKPDKSGLYVDLVNGTSITERKPIETLRVEQPELFTNVRPIH